MMKPQLILADDDDGFRALLGDILMDAGYGVLKAANGNEALGHCEAQHVVAAVVDIIMPEKEGLETIFEMRRRFPNIKIVAMSGGGRGSAGTYLEMALKIGADAVLAKPFSSAQFLDTIRGVLASSAP
jgi:CheY-like chemotaxis protein